MIREGTAAKNMDALMPLFQEPYCNRCMLVTDDKHPGDLMKLGHMDHLVKKAVQNGANPILAIKMATLHPAMYFGLKDSGAVAPGYKADLVIIKDMDTFSVDKVLKNGVIAATDGQMKQNARSIQDNPMNEEAAQKVYVSFHMKELVPADFQLKEEGNKMRVIELTSGELLTKLRIVDFKEPGVDIANDIIKLAVAERHHNTGHIGLGFLKGYGLREGAIASSIAHDS
jgi:adenine deaminase